MISVRAARALVLQAAHALPAERVALADASGRVLTTSVRTPVPLPRFTNAAMDGYALRAVETRGASTGRVVRLPLHPKTAFAGSGARPGIPPHTAVRVMTGAPVPPCLDAVLPLEEARVEGGALLVAKRIPPGRYVRRAGEDCRRGVIVARAGTPIDPGIVALLSACGIVEVGVHRQPRVAVVVTGDEIRDPSDRTRGKHTVCDTHSGFLRSALREFGLEPVSLDRSRDSALELRSKLARALDGADILLVTGGVSVGRHDLVRKALSSLRVRTVFWKVAQKPGKPLYFGKRGGTLVFGLPGNPVSTVVCYCEYVRPCLRRMLGFPNGGGVERVASLDRPVPGPNGRTLFLRGRVTLRSGTLWVTPILPEGSHRFYPFRHSDCLITVPPGSGAPLRRRSRVTIHLFPWTRE